MFENPRRGRQARNLTTNVPKILDLKSPSEQIFSKNCRWVTPDVPPPRSIFYQIYTSLLSLDYLLSLICISFITGLFIVSVVIKITGAQGFRG